MPSPFPPTSTKPGHGQVHLTLLPPATPAYSSLTYTYPLKLLPSTPHILPTSSTSLTSSKSATPDGSTSQAKSKTASPSTVPISVPLLFLLTYGGGLVSGDHISLTIRLDASTRLTVTTQGSTKIFKPSVNPPPTTHQDLHVSIAPHAALWLAPDPVQPFAESIYAQTQIFEVEREGSLGIVDWVSEGRRARGEKWDLKAWRGRNEIWSVYGERAEGWEKKKRLLVRDAVVLDGDVVAGRMDRKGVFGTVLLRGPLFSELGAFFVGEFEALPRIGGRSWAADGEAVKELSRMEEWRAGRLWREKEDGVLWTACHVRGCTVVKFTATEVEGARSWLRSMLREEGTVAKECGEGGLMLVR